MDKHRFNIFPEMLDDDYQRLKTDLQQNGFDEKQPIYIYEDAVLDGWNRLKACNELGIKPVVKTFFGSDVEAIQFVMRTNKRRNLNSSQWAVIAVEAEEIVGAVKQAVEAERYRKMSETKTGMEYGKNSCNNKLLQQKSPNENAVHTILAETFNTNRTYVNDAWKLKTEKPELFEQVKKGEKTLTEVKREVKKQERKTDIESQIKTIQDGYVTEITGVFDVIAVDPPWPYGRVYDPETSRVANPYPEMSIEEIKNISLPLNENAVVFLWTTHAFIKYAFEIIEAWGLKYKATMVWDKENMGMGATIRMQCEFCLIAFKGNPYFDGVSERDIIREQRREHSRKPEAFFQFVERATIGNRLEYFSRETRKNWTTYGNDTKKF